MSAVILTIPTSNQYVLAFKRAAADNKSYLLEFEEIVARNDFTVKNRFFLSVKNQSDIVPLLKSLNNAPYEGLNRSLVGVFDLSADFKSHASGVENLETVLSAQIREELNRYGHEREVQAWKSRPWVQRLFIPKPALEQ